MYMVYMGVSDSCHCFHFGKNSVEHLCVEVENIFNKQLWK